MVFLFNLQNVSQVDIAINEQKQKLLTAGSTLQPVPVFVGTINNIQDAYVVIKNIKYRADAPIDAIDLVFKIFYATDSKYPDAAQYVWQLIETIGFDLPRVQTEKIPPSFKTLINDFKNTNYY